MLLLDGRDDPTKKNGMGAVWVTMDEKDEKYEAMYADHKQMVEQVPTRLPRSTCSLPNSLPTSLPVPVACTQNNIHGRCARRS